MFPIDAVYTWADFSDPALQKNIMRYWNTYTPHNRFPEFAYCAHDELRYSLRSLECNAPWIRTVYIVTNGQLPTWLRTDHPKVVCISHKDIFPDAKMLPSFNSFNIEAYIHRIPGLSEHFLSLNDDFFFGSPVSAETFFTQNGCLKFFPTPVWVSATPSNSAPLYMRTWQHSNTLLNKYFPISSRWIPSHVVRPMRVSVCEEVARKFEPELTMSCRVRFRHPNGVAIPSFIAPWWALYTGRGEVGRCATTFVQVTDDIGDTCANIRKAFTGNTYKLVCINDTKLQNTDVVWSGVHATLNRLFPAPSSYELPPAYQCATTKL